MNEMNAHLRRVVRCLPEQEPDLPETGKRDADQELATLAKALGHPVRVKIMRLLLSRAECLCGEICEHLPLAQSTVSQHLKILKAAGLIRGKITRPRICYCASGKRLATMRKLLESLAIVDSRGAIQPQTKE